MADRIALMLEAERRGILPPDKAALLGEARRRGLVPNTEQEQELSPASGMDRANAFAAGVNSGAARLVGVPVDTMANIRDIGKAAVGTLVGEFSKGEPVPVRQGKPGPYGTGRSFDVDEDGNLVISTKVPAAEIPNWLQIKPREWDFGSGEYNRSLLNRIPGRPAENPRPDDTASRYLFAGGEAVPMAVAGARMAPQVPQAGMQLPTHIATNVAGAEAAQLAGESGAGPEGQVLAGMLAGAGVAGARSTIAEGTKRSFRGGEEGRQRTAQNIQDFEDAGVQPTAGQATQTRRAQAMESLLARTPGAAGRMTAKAEQISEGIGSSVEKLAAQLSPKASGEQAGRAIQAGVTGSGGFLDTFKSKSASNYNELDKFVKPDATFKVSNTVNALNKLTTPIKGAENTSSRMINSKLRAINDALGEDLTANNGVLPYRAVKELRTLIGNEIADAPLTGDVPTAQLKQLYGALSQDMAAAAQQSGPKAVATLNRANNYHSAGMKRLDVINSVLDKNGGPEAIFRAATSGAKEGATTLRAVMQSLPADAQKTLSASVLRRLGRATAGRQDDLGETFSTETFLTNWNTLSPQAKVALFDRHGTGFRADLDNVAKVASNLRSGSKVFQNPSGTGQAVAQSATAATAALAVLTGNFGAAAAIGAGAGGANLSARLMTNPNFVKWLAKTTKAPPKALPALLVQLESGTEDEQEFARLLKAQTQETRR